MHKSMLRAVMPQVWRAAFTSVVAPSAASDLQGRWAQRLERLESPFALACAPSECHPSLMDLCVSARVRSLGPRSSSAASRAHVRAHAHPSATSGRAVKQESWAESAGVQVGWQAPPGAHARPDELAIGPPLRSHAAHLPLGCRSDAALGAARNTCRNESKELRMCRERCRRIASFTR